MAAIANAFSPEIFEPYVLFSKTGKFTLDDVANCRLAQPEYMNPRVILLSDEELERERIFDTADSKVQIRGRAASLESLAEFTRETYFGGKDASDK